MNFKTILNILSALLTIMGLSMLFPAFISWLYNEPDLLSFIYSSGISVSLGLPIWFITRKSRTLRNRDGFAIVTFSWIITALAGSLPFYLSGVIPNFTDAWFDSVCHGFTTMPTGGFSTQNASIAAYSNPAIHYIIIFFMFVAGVNFTLHFRALTGNFKAHVKDYEFRVYLTIIFISTLIIFFNISSTNSDWTHDSFLKSLFQSLAILTGTGYSNANYELWPYLSQHLLLILMFFGAMGGSTSGGMKIARIILLIKYAITETRRMLHARAVIPIKIGNRTISDEIVRNTLGFSLIYLSIFVLTAFVLSSFNLDFQSAVGAAASAIGNIGPAFGSFGPTDNYALLHPLGKWMLTFCMLLGRLEIFTVMVIFSKVFWK